jgi:hypothetical protein
LYTRSEPNRVYAQLDETSPIVFLFASALLLPAADSTSEPPIRLQVDLAAPGKAISPDLVGVFFEDLNYAADGGLYAELIQNRSFEYSATEQGEWGPFYGWDLVKTAGGDGQLGLGDSRPVHPNNPHYLLLTVLEPGLGVGLANKGFDQIPVAAGKSYEASFWAYQAYMGSCGRRRTRPDRCRSRSSSKRRMAPFSPRRASR